VYKRQELSDEDGATVVTRTLDGLSYIYDLDDDLDEDATYSWSVRGINTATGFESPWSSATFTTGVPTATPIWVWIMIAIGAVVAIVVIVLIVRTRRPV
jgi:anti-sigma-K factor RskA